MAFPALLFIIALASTVGDSINNITFGGIIGPGVFTLFVVLAVFGWFYPARIIRAVVLSLREKEFIEAARMTGSSDWRIIRSHILPHLVAPITVYSTLSVAQLHPRRGRPLVPRRRHQAADRELGQPPPGGPELLHGAAVADGLARPRGADHDAGLQPARRRPPRRVRSALDALSVSLLVSLNPGGRSRLDLTCRSTAMKQGFAVNEELTKLPPPRHMSPRMRSAPEPTGSDQPSARPQERSMSLSRKLWLSTVTVAIALLAVFAGSAVAKTGKGKAGAVRAAR